MAKQYFHADQKPAGEAIFVLRIELIRWTASIINLNRFSLVGGRTFPGLSTIKGYRILSFFAGQAYALSP